MRAPVTPAQQRLWFLAQVDPDALDYHIPLAYRLRGPLDTAALAGAIGDVVARHGALRTRFPLDGAGPVQEVLDGWRPGVAVRDTTAAGDCYVGVLAAALDRGKRLPDAMREASAAAALACERAGSQASLPALEDVAVRLRDALPR